MSDNDVKVEQQAPAQQPQEPATGESPEPVVTPSAFEQLAQKKGFKSPDDLAKSYQELEKHSKAVESDRANLEKLFFQEEPTKERAEAKPDTDDAALKELDQFVDQRLREREAQLRTEMETRFRRMELQSVLKDNPDFGKYASDVKELVKKYPSMSFTEAYTFAKAQKGDLANEARSEAFRSSQESRQAQQAAQSAPAKPVAEEKIGPEDLLRGAGARWSPNARGQMDPRAVAEIEQVEKEIFGRVLPKTNLGI